MRFCAEATGCSARVTCSSKARATAPACPARLTETSSAPPTPGFAFRRAGDRSPVTSAVDAHLRAGGSHISTSRSNIAAIRLCGFLSRAVGLLGHEKTIGLESIVFGPQPSHRHRPMLCCPHAPIGRHAHRNPIAPSGWTQARAQCRARAHGAAREAGGACGATRLRACFTGGAAGTSRYGPVDGRAVGFFAQVGLYCVRGRLGTARRALERSTEDLRFFTGL